MADWYLSPPAPFTSRIINAASYNRLNVDTFGLAIRFRVSGYAQGGYLFTTPQLHVTMDSSTGAITVSIRINSSSGSAGYSHYNIPTIPSLNTWHTLVVRRTAFPNPVLSRVFLDGVLESSLYYGTNTFGSFSQNPELAICSRGVNTGFMGPSFSPVSFYYTGEINDIAVWRGVTLTDTDALNLHNAAPSTWDSVVPAPTNYWTWDNQLPTDIGSDGIATTANAATLYDTDDFAITPTNLPTANYQGAYSQTLTAVNGGLGPYTWSISSGSLPPGLTLGVSTSDTVTISGTVTDALEIGTTYTFTVQVQEGANTTTEGYTILVGPGLIVVSDIPPAAVGVPYSFAVLATGGSGSASWAISGTLPTGLSFDPATGTISGTPTTFTSNLGSPVTLTATREAGNWTSGNVTRYVAVTIGQATLAPLTLSGGSVGTSYNETITATSIEPPADYSLQRFVSVLPGYGSLPPGLTFSTPGFYSTTATISGTPTTPGTYTFVVYYQSLLDE